MKGKPQERELDEGNKNRNKAEKQRIKSHVGIWVLRARVYPASVTSP
jgi:hypothetical protein